MKMNFVNLWRKCLEYKTASARPCAPAGKKCFPHQEEISLPFTKKREVALAPALPYAGDNKELP